MKLFTTISNPDIKNNGHLIFLDHPDSCDKNNLSPNKNIFSFIPMATNKHMRTHILITSATLMEIENLIQLTNIKNKTIIGGRSIFSGNFSGKNIKILITGPGPVNTAQAVTAAIERFQPECIINTGCAGAFKKAGLQIGDIGIATEEIDIHLGIEPEKRDHPLTRLPFPVIKTNNGNLYNRFPCSDELSEAALIAITQHFTGIDIRIKKGPFITVSTITATDTRANHLFSQYSPCMEAMEGSAAAHVSAFYNIPFLEIRSASNLVGKRDTDTWNFPLSFTRITETINAFLRYTT